jgi:hypothetical protein
MPLANLIAAGLSSLRLRNRIVNLDRNGGISIVPADFQMLNHVPSMAAIGFVAFVLLFVHPASQASRAAAHQMAAASTTATVNAAASDMRPRLAASK